jgi:hypothetical protein
MKTNRVLTFAIAVAFAGAIPMAVANQGQPLVCGNAKISVSPAKLRGGEQVLQDFLVSVAQPNNTKTFKFSAENDLLQVRCETNRNGEPVLLVNHYCSGSGCSESNFSIIDLKTYEVLLSANARQKGNHSAAESILGKKLKPFSCGHSQAGSCYAASFE